MRGSRLSQQDIAPAIKFLTVGGINTLLTYSIFIGLTFIVKTWIAFSLAYVLGLVWTVFMNSKWVFGSRSDLKNMTHFGAIHILLFLIGQAVIWLSADQGIEDKLLISVTIIAFTAPISFFSGKFVFTRNQR